MSNTNPSIQAKIASPKSNYDYYWDDYPFLGEIRMVPFNYAPQNWQLCDGTLLPINQYEALFSLLAFRYGGDGSKTFGVPNLCGRFPCHPKEPYSYNRPNGGAESVQITIPVNNIVSSETGTAVNAVTAAVSPITVPTLPPYLALNFIIATAGIYPFQD